MVYSPLLKLELEFDTKLDLQKTAMAIIKTVVLAKTWRTQKERNSIFFVFQLDWSLLDS
jgi:hypothetical protein